MFAVIQRNGYDEWVIRGMYSDKESAFMRANRRDRHWSGLENVKVVRFEVVEENGDLGDSAPRRA